MISHDPSMQSLSVIITNQNLIIRICSRNTHNITIAMVTTTDSTPTKFFFCEIKLRTQKSVVMYFLTLDFEDNFSFNSSFKSFNYNGKIELRTITFKKCSYFCRFQVIRVLLFFKRPWKANHISKIFRIQMQLMICHCKTCNISMSVRAQLTIFHWPSQP